MTAEKINMKLLPGEPTDGTGRLLIHYLVPDSQGKIVTTKSLTNDKNDLTLQKGHRFDLERRWRLVCRPEQNTITTQRINGQQYVCLTSPDIHAVTCPTCLASADADAARTLLREAQDKVDARQKKLLADAQAGIDEAHKRSLAVAQ